MSIVLASASMSRRNLLRAAGVEFTVDPADINEENIREEMSRAHGSAEGCARRLAEEKAQYVSRRYQGLPVIGADQILEVGNEWLAKSGEREALRRQLLQLRGREHRLVTAASVVADGRVLWSHVVTAKLTMRVFSEDFLETYLETADPGVTGCVGGYQLEDIGIQLFDQIDGDYFAILGLPLLPLLSFLRSLGCLPT